MTASSGLARDAPYGNSERQRVNRESKPPTDMGRGATVLVQSLVPEPSPFRSDTSPYITIKCYPANPVSRTMTERSLGPAPRRLLVCQLIVDSTRAVAGRRSLRMLNQVSNGVRATAALSRLPDAAFMRRRI